MQPEAAAVAEECWRAEIPIQLRLADSDVSSLEHPPVLYFLLPRQSYLHNLVAQALPLLQHLLPPGERVPWFEHGHLPLKWNVPAGVLYDLVAAPSAELPWRLTLHFRGFPDRQLPAYGGEAALRGAFFNSLKEAAHICRGSAQRVMEMAGGAQEDLWQQVLSSSLQQYSQIVAPLQLVPTASRGRASAAVPLRLYIRRGAGAYLSSYQDIACTSRPVLAQAADGSPISLRQALLPLLEAFLQEAAAEEDPPAAAAGAAAAAAARAPPDAAAGGGEGSSEDAEAPPLPAQSEPSAGGLADSTADGAGGEPAAGGAAGSEADKLVAPSGEAGASTASVAAGTAAAAPVPAAAAAASAAEQLLERAVAARGVLVGGTAPPLDAPLSWLHAQLRAGDYFLYVVLHIPCA